MYVDAPVLSENTKLIFEIKAVSNTTETEYTKQVTLGFTSTSNRSLAKGLKIATTILIIIGILIAIGSSIFDSSPNSLWALINHHQLLILLPLTDAYIPYEVTQFLIGIDFTIMPFKSVVQKDYPISQIYTSFECTQAHEYLSDIGFEHGSTTLNLINTIEALLVLVALHLFIILLYQIGKNLYLNEETPTMMFKIITRACKFFTFGFYIRSVLEMLITILLPLCQELHEFNTKTDGLKVSLGISIFLAAGVILFVLFAIYIQTQAFREKDISRYPMFEELYFGIKKTIGGYNYMTFFMIQRLFLISWLTFGSKYDKYIKITGGFVFQTLYTLYICIGRPFGSPKVQIIEAKNQILFLGLIGSLFYYAEEARWNDKVSTRYLVFLSLSSLLFIIIQAIHFIIIL